MTTVYDALEQSYRVRLRRRYRIVALRNRASYRVALNCTYSTGAAIVKKSLTEFRKTLNHVRELWLQRLWNLGQHELWLYQRGLSPEPHEIDPARLLRAFELYADCRPRCVVYMPPPEWVKEKEHKPCNRSNFCPHCWAALVARQTQRIKQLINAYIAHRADARLTITTQISEYFFSSCGIGGTSFSTPEERHTAILHLRQQIERCRKYLDSTRKAVYRNTFAAAWRIVIEPVEDGWTIQIRQLFLTTEKQTPPTGKPRWARTVLRKSATAEAGHSWKQRKSDLTMDGEIYDRIIEFGSYPLGWLTNDIELTAIYLNAAAATKLLGGSGKLRRFGRQLVREFVLLERDIKNAAAARRA